MDLDVQTASLDQHGAIERSTVSPQLAAPRKRSPQEKAAETRRRRQTVREDVARLNTITLLMDQPPGDICHFPRFRVSNGDIDSALDEAIADVRDAMRPPSPEEIASERRNGVLDPSPLMCDVAVVRGGKILAVIQYSADGPVVTRLPAADRGPRADPD